MDDETEAERMAVATLSGDMRDIMLTHIRSQPKPWAKMSEGQQQETIDAVEQAAEDLVRRAVALISRRGFDLVPIKLADFTVKGGALKGKFEAIVTETNVVSLSDHQGHSAVIVLTDPSDFIGERSEARADPDQPDMLNEVPAQPELEDA